MVMIIKEWRRVLEIITTNFPVLTRFEVITVPSVSQKPYKTYYA